MKNPFCTITTAIKELKRGKMLIVVDDPRRENEGDFFCPAETISSTQMTDMIRLGGGLICVAITRNQAARLSLPLMVEPEKNLENTKVNFTVSVNAKNGVTTGVSAHDRLKTIKIVGNPKSKAEDLVKPGHVFPLIAAAGGILERQGHTEAAVDLAKVAGFSPTGVLCEIIKNDGKMARLPDLVKLVQKMQIKIVSISDLNSFREKHPFPKEKTSWVVKTASSLLPTIYGTFHLLIYTSLLDGREHSVLMRGKPNKQPILTRIHSQCLTGDTLLSLKCDCREQLHQSMEMMGKKGEGIIIYLNQEGRGIGLTNKIKAYALQKKGLDTVEANHALGLPTDSRDYQIASEILYDLGVTGIILLTNNPQKITGLVKYGIRIVKRIPLEISPNQFNSFYLATKKQKLNHHLSAL